MITPTPNEKTVFEGSVAGSLSVRSPGNRHVPDVQVRYSLTCTMENHFDPLLTLLYSQMR